MKEMTIFEYLKGKDLERGYRIVGYHEDSNSVYILGTNSSFNIEIPNLIEDLRVNHREIYNDLEEKFPEYFL